MSVITYIHHFVVSNLLTVYYNLYAIFVMTVCLLKNPFKSLWSQKKRLIPPSPLSDPKYGVHKYIKVNNDTKLHYVESGDSTKPLMIFVHGYPEFWYSWRHQILEFKKDYWCIAVDLRGYGDSERPDGLAPYHIELLVEDLRDLVRQLGRQKCILVSHDWGGLISCRFRDVHPDALIALVMLSSTSREAWFHELWHNPAQRKMSWYVFLYRMPVIPELFMQIYDLVMLEKALLVPGKDTITNEDVECYKYWFSKQYALTPPINYYRSNFLFSLPEKKYKEENIPMLVANAQNDAYLNRELLELMKKEYAHIETAIVEGCGHFLQQEEPTKVNKLIRDFLSKNKL